MRAAPQRKSRQIDGFLLATPHSPALRRVSPRFERAFLVIRADSRVWAASPPIEDGPLDHERLVRRGRHTGSATGRCSSAAANGRAGSGAPRGLPATAAASRSVTTSSGTLITTTSTRRSSGPLTGVAIAARIGCARRASGERCVRPTSTGRRSSCGLPATQMRGNADVRDTSASYGRRVTTKPGYRPPTPRQAMSRSVRVPSVGERLVAAEG